jgi:hypothetical protein
MKGRKNAGKTAENFNFGAFYLGRRDVGLGSDGVRFR